MIRMHRFHGVWWKVRNGIGLEHAGFGRLVLSMEWSASMELVRAVKVFIGTHRSESGLTVFERTSMDETREVEEVSTCRILYSYQKDKKKKHTFNNGCSRTIF